MHLAGVADEIQQRLIHLFARDNNGERAYNGGSQRMNLDPHFRDRQSSSRSTFCLGLRFLQTLHFTNISMLTLAEDWVHHTSAAGESLTF